MALFALGTSVAMMAGPWLWLRLRGQGAGDWGVRLAGLALAGVAFLVFGWRLLPRDRKGAASMDAAFNLEGYTTEVEVPEEQAASVDASATADRPARIR